MTKIPLARYTGQVGDGVRDAGNHQTDLRWVSPGSSQSPDQPASVPVDANTPINPATNQPYTFELNLARDLPDIAVDPVTGERIVYMGVTALPPGGSKNTFAIWAGPDNDAATIPSDVNARNLHLLNNRSAHQGVHVLGKEALPVQTLSDQGIDVPLLYLRPEYAGQTVYLNVFDLDTGSQPPINFYIDTLAYTPDDSENGFDETQTDWAVARGFPGDPIGGCFTDPYSGACNDRFIGYSMTLPTDLGCNSSSPDTCTPLYGGRLMAHIQGGSLDGVEYDAYTWSVRWGAEEPPAVAEWDNTEGCSAFPIGVDQAIRSVLDPDDSSSGANRWRVDFDYPIPGVDYDDYITHQPNVPLLDAKPGYLYNIQNGASSGGKGWLAWNHCVQDSSALVNSLTWPGNSKDYNPLTGTCIVNGETMGRFPGFMEVGDNTDKSMHTGDWVSISTANANSNSLVDTLEEHVDLDRTLRVIVYDGITASQPYAYRIGRFALMRLLGFSVSMGGGESFIMAEFVGWDDTCGQIAAPPLTGGDGPGGVGRTDGSTELALWLQADEGALTEATCTPDTEAGDSDTVACWADQSGKGNHATATTNGPALQTAVINGQPHLQFDGSNYLNDTLTLNGRSGFTFFEVAQAENQTDYQSILRFQDAADSYIIYPDAGQLSLSSDQGSGSGVDVGLVANEWNIGTAVYQLNTVNGMRTYRNSALVDGRNSNNTALPADNLTIGRNSATQAAYTNADVAELIVFERPLILAERTLVENYLSAKYALPIANDKYDGDTPENGGFDLDVAGIGQETGEQHTVAESAGMIVSNISFLMDGGDYLLFGHRTAVNGNTNANLPQGGAWENAPNPQRWNRHWYVDLTEAGINRGGSVAIVFDFSDAGMAGLPAEPASNYRLLKRTATDGEFMDIATATEIEGDRVIFSNIYTGLLGSNFTLGSLDAGQSPTAVTLETAVVQSSSSTPVLLIIILTLILIGLTGLVALRRQLFVR